MVGYAWQTPPTPPAIERRITGQDREQWGDKTGGIDSAMEIREDESKSSTLTVLGSTGAGGKMGIQTERVKSAEDRPGREGQHTAEFSEYLFNHKTAELISLLNDLKPN